MLYYLSHNDIDSDRLDTSIADALYKSKRFLYLTATQNIKEMRSKPSGLSFYVVPYDRRSKEDANLYSSNEFVQMNAHKVYEQRGFLSTSDQKFILAKVIGHFYADRPDKGATMYRMRYDLYELFRLLLFYDKSISEEQLSAIGEDFSVIESDIFALYALYTQVLDNFRLHISENKPSTLLDEILGNNFYGVGKHGEFTRFDELHKRCIMENLSSCDTLILEGFLFLDEMQKFIVTSALVQEISVYIISKQFPDGRGGSAFADGIQAIADSMGIPVEHIPLLTDKPRPKTALGYIKSVFPIQNLKPPQEAEKLLDDGSIRFIRPFVSREEELRYVAKEISKRLKDSYTGDADALIQTLQNDFTIVLSQDKEKHQERIANIFREVGLFVLDKTKLIRHHYEAVDLKSFEQIYFNRHDFLNAAVKWQDGRELTFHERHELFERCFLRIDVNRSARPVMSYPVGQFVLELYRIISDGMSIEGFKGILYSNWRYTVDRTALKWSDFISDFKYIEIFLEHHATISEWCDTAAELRRLKDGIEDNPLYIYHPLKAVSAESLGFFCELLNELKELINKISGVVGDIDSHLNMLKTVVMRADSIMGMDSDKLEFEQLVLIKLVQAIGDISASSLIQNLDASYFAQNIRAMFSDWEAQNEIEVESVIRLNVVNLENVREYKCCYFIMCEADKYPRRHAQAFPFTDDMLKILQAPKYGFEIAPSSIKSLDYHLEVERYLFQNVLDFTTQELTITYCEKEDGRYNKPSIYAYDIAAAFGFDIPFIEEPIFEESQKPAFSRVEQAIHLDRKPVYTLSDLAIFKLCPRLYYHREADGNRAAYLSRLQLKFYAEAVLYCDLLRRFMDYNLAHKKVYAKGSPEHEGIIKDLFKESCTENIPYFSFMSKYEIEDTISNVASKITGYIENAVKNIKGDSYTVISYENKRYGGDGYEVIIEHDNRVVDYDYKKWRMSQSSNYLEFLVLKTSDGKSELTHYADMIKALDANSSYEDRVNLVSRIIAKINIQFDSKTFANDGIARTDELVRQIGAYDFGTAAVMPSEYCGYCRLNDVCMER